MVKTYGRPYKFQQQDGCRDRGSFSLSVPAEPQDFENTSISERDDDGSGWQEMGVSFKAWLERDPEKSLNTKFGNECWCIELWWTRNFYPDIQMVANDLLKKSLIEPGEYLIIVD